MKYYTLTKDEDKLLKAFEQKKLKRVPQLKKQKVLYEAAARATLSKTKNINIRLSEKDILGLKSKAVQKGIPYQTLVSSVLHQYSNGQMEERRT